MSFHSTSVVAVTLWVRSNQEIEQDSSINWGLETDFSHNCFKISFKILMLPLFISRQYFSNLICVSQNCVLKNINFKSFIVNKIKWNIMPLNRWGSNFFLQHFIAPALDLIAIRHKTFSKLWLSVYKRAKLDLRLTKYFLCLLACLIFNQLWQKIYVLFH